MFVQHMVAFSSDGKLASVMPHGVLFRGGEESLPPALHQGRRSRSHHRPARKPVLRHGHPGLLLVLNRAGARSASVLFINADREYREGKNQNHLRPEDIEKITHVYRRRVRPRYSRVSRAEIETEEFNRNIRRYVDNSPPPEPHDVRAHLHGGVP